MECASVHGELDFDHDTEPSRLTIIARKRWKCDECDKRFEIGEEMVFHSSRIAGRLSISRVCPDCQSVIDNLFQDWYTGQVWSDLSDHLWNCDGEISYEAVAKLTRVARAMVCDMIEKVWAGDSK